MTWSGQGGPLQRPAPSPAERTAPPVIQLKRQAIRRASSCPERPSLNPQHNVINRGWLTLLRAGLAGLRAQRADPCHQVAIFEYGSLPGGSSNPRPLYSDYRLQCLAHEPEQTYNESITGADGANRRHDYRFSGRQRGRSRQAFSRARRRDQWRPDGQQRTVCRSARTTDHPWRRHLPSSPHLPEQADPDQMTTPATARRLVIGTLRAAALSGCLALSAAAAEDVVIHDARGRDVTVGHPNRIVSIGGAITEILYALGAEDRIVAVDTTSLYPPKAMIDKPNVGYMRQ